MHKRFSTKKSDKDKKHREIAQVEKELQMEDTTS
jgi:hypothetical protein